MNKDYQELVLQWKTHEVSRFLLSQFEESRVDLISQIASGRITADNAAEKNFMLGKLELLNQVLDEEFYTDLIESLQEGL
jgi:hypothetical protein